MGQQLAHNAYQIHSFASDSRLYNLVINIDTQPTTLFDGQTTPITS
ncbi:hypothetical protein DDB_G0268046 [Dictyostelium discoideum AX4]|uniref:Putative uncharacterized protein DDB_G0268046 n=1 Tax=Dictyostelium discoideum TaxID=44689 RepID=Y9737_DICDI|nr:hypothetical protein DDB_G0268046 [Dictyostelium discoideum AX4]Q55FM1.1 RecName: Full=Putative uncharacterized protein DDB_G0268046 [Dictyostelium discoideum]EAL73476.1 hypothetical protein DDB_G0268046 [Dictyostelium discoideum AX4]|eukprot:XP_647512.1 hypothetical protein DDB_G0268046 [Dictyostelium discoideum AX4]